MSRRVRVAGLLVPLVALVPLLAACEEDDLGGALSIEAFGRVTGTLLFDADGTGTSGAADDPLEGWTLRLEQPAGGTVVSDETDEDGEVVFEEVPVGRLVARVTEEELGDTLSQVEASIEPFTLAAAAEVSLVVLVTLPELTVEEVRETPPDEPLFVTGVALNGFPAEDERTLHIRGEEQYLRIVSVEEGTVFAGDSVRVRGRTDAEQGVPIMDGQEVFRLRGGAAPAPIELSTAAAADAEGGSLDAALVQIADAEILSVEDLGRDGVRLEIDDGSGVLSILLREFLDFEADDFDPDDQLVARATGLLVPGPADGRVVWELLPRSRSDLNVQAR